MRYSWNEAKNRHNITLHGISFQDAQRIRRSSHLIEAVINLLDRGAFEYAIGLVNGLEVTVVYTDKNDEERRIISAWRSQPHERRAYWNNIEV